ncbi:MAG: GEVED domain-containing protein, partial [Flavobacteriales bacterium]
GDPAPDATTGPASVCSGVNFTLGIANATTESGISYQWYADNGSGPVTVGTNSSTYTTSQTVATAYYVAVTCANGGATVNSATRNVAMNAPTACYCTPASSNTNYYINSFTTTGGTQNIGNTATGYSAGGYGDFTAQTVAQVASSTVNFTASLSTSTTFGLKIWVDWDQNGIFEAGEVAFNTSSYSSNHTGTITVPITATPGVTRMRVGISSTPNTGPANPCSTSNNGEYEDYSFEVIAPTSCAGTPVSSTAAASVSEVCAEIPFNLTGTGVNESGITYQWQRSAAGAGSWSNITGATSASYTVSAGINASTDYRLVVTCTNSSLSSNSNVVNVALKAIVDCFCTPTITSTVEPICNVTFAGINNSSPSATGGPGYQDFTGSVAAGAVDAGSSYVISATGNTNGNFTTYFTAFFDWDQNGTFETAVPMGSTTNNVCVTAVTTTVNVPQNAVGGTTRMRVIKNFNTSPANACGSYSYGQAEDYLLNVTAFVCGEVVVNITTDNNPEQLSWEITDENNTVIASGAPVGANQLVSVTACLGAAPINGCFGFRLMDSFGDGITNGGWELRTTGGKLLLRDDFAGGSVSPAIPSANPSYGTTHSFCLPQGPANIAP